MLYVTFRDPEPEFKKELILSMKHFFPVHFENEWLLNDISRNILYDINKDEVEVVRGIPCIFTPLIAGKSYNISVDKISGGSQLLLYCYNVAQDVLNNYIFLSSIMGDNCYPWLFRIAETKDIYLLNDSSFYVPSDRDNYDYNHDKFGKFSDIKLKVYNLDNNRIYTGFKDVFDMFIDGRGGEFNSEVT